MDIRAQVDDGLVHDVDGSIVAQLSETRSRAPPRKYGNMTTTDETQWLPLGVEDYEIAEFTAPWTEVPEWFQTSLWEWIARNLVARGYGGGAPVSVGR